MNPTEVAMAIAIGAVSGALSGLFGVGGGIVMTPGIQTALGTTPIVALATPLPVIFPTAISGALRYRAAGELDLRAAGWLIAGGIPAAVVGAALTELIATELLLMITAALLAWQSVGIIRGGGPRRAGDAGEIRVGPVLLIGVAAGFISGLLGIGGGLIMVPLLAGWLGMPLKRALGTSLAAIVGMVVPGSIVHAALGNVAWDVALWLAVGSIPGARVGARLALGTRERTLRLLVGGFMLAVAVLYGAEQVRALTGR